MFKKSIITFLLIICATISSIKSEIEPETKQIAPECCSMNLLAACIRNLHTMNLFSDTGCIEKFRSNDLCTQQLSTRRLCTENARINNLCAVSVQAPSLCARRTDSNTLCTNDAQVQSLCAGRGVMTNLCVTNSLRHCSPFSAHVSLNTDVEYTLGTPIPFDTIISHPGNSVLFSPTRFQVPESGYYVVTARAVAANQSLLPQSLVACLDININGNLRRRVMIPYWLINSFQHITATHLMLLNAGTEVTFTYRVFINNPLEGLVELQGQTILVGNSLRSFRSFFTIHYLSSNCQTLNCQCPIQPCIECPQCEPFECPDCGPCTSEEHPCPAFCFNT